MTDSAWAPRSVHTKNEQSPFAVLKYDDSHYAFTKYLDLVDILSASEASYHINKYASEFIFPHINTLDFTSPQNNRICSLPPPQQNRIIHMFGPQITTVELDTNSSHSRVNSLIFSKCRNIQELVLHDFGSNEEASLSAIPNINRLRFMNCDYMDLPEIFKRVSIEELEINGRWFYFPDTNLFYNQLRLLSISRSTLLVSDLLAVLQRNAATLRSLKLSHNYRLEEYDTAGFWHNLPSLVPNVTDLSVCGREIGYLTHGNFERLEVDQPLDLWMLDLLPRFLRLRSFLANYTSNFDSPLSLSNIERDESLLRRSVDRLLQMETLDELHLIVDNPELLRRIRAAVATLTMPDNYHLHVFVYSRSKARLSRGETTCRMRLVNGNGGHTKCKRTHLVDHVSNNRCEMQQDLSNILYDDD